MRTSRSPAGTAVAAALLGSLLLALGGCAGEPQGEAESATSADPSDVARDTDLRAELLQMAALDQAVRGGLPPPGMTAAEAPTIDEVDATNQSRLEEILDEHGWPGWALVGRAGSTAAWTIAQHADLDLDLQRRALELLTTAVEADDASAGDLAYLTDRVRVADGEPQVYGTQWEPRRGRWVPRTPIEDRATVDERRAAAGLGPLREYVAELETSLPSA